MPVSTGQYAHSSGTVAALVAAGTPATLFSFDGYNHGPAQFVQVHDGTAVPATGATPVYCCPAAGTAAFAPSAAFRAIACSAGVVLCNSTTAPTLTAGTTNCQFHAWIQ